MSISRGVAITAQGSFVCATVISQSRKCRIKRIAEWNSSSHLRNFFLLHHTVTLVLPSQWVRTAPSETEDFTIQSLPEGFHVCLRQSDIDHFGSLLADNIHAILPDMALLLTLPRAFGNDLSAASFCSILNDHGTLRVGIVTEMKLQAVFSVAGIETPRELEGFIGRIERYWKNSVHEMRAPFPSGVIYLVNALPFELSEEFPAIKIDCGTDHPDELKAVGAALCDSCEKPLEFNPVPGAGSAVLKAAVFFTALALIVSALLCTGAFFLYQGHLERRITAIKSNYNNLLDNNGDLRALIEEGDAKARRLLQRNTLVNQPTTWGRFLQTIGANRPEDLHFERLGSEPIDHDTTGMRIAIIGWSKSETIVTDFIKTLSTSPLLDNVSLSSMERIPKDEHSCTFKIVCKLLLSEK